MKGKTYRFLRYNDKNRKRNTNLSNIIWRRKHTCSQIRIARILNIKIWLKAYVRRALVYSKMQYFRYKKIIRKSFKNRL